MQSADGGILSPGLHGGARLTHQLTGDRHLPLFVNDGAGLLNFLTAFHLLTRARQGQPQLVPGRAEIRVELQGFLKVRDRVRDLIFSKQQFAELKVRGGKSGLQLDDLSKLCHGQIHAVLRALSVG